MNAICIVVGETADGTAFAVAEESPLTVFERRFPKRPKGWAAQQKRHPKQFGMQRGLWCNPKGA